MPGTQVVIGLSESQTQPEKCTDLTNATTDAAGTFVALFLLPADPRWLSLSEVWAVAHTRDFGKVAIASFRPPQSPTATPSPRPTTIASPTIELAVYALGYVQEVSLASRTIKITPVEGQIKTIIVGEGAQLTYAGQPAQLADIHIGDLIEASGRISTRDGLTASQVRILTRVQATVQPTALPTPTMAPIVWLGPPRPGHRFSMAGRSRCRGSASRQLRCAMDRDLAVRGRGLSLLHAGR
jgi:hypothetical protein